MNKKVAVWYNGAYKQFTREYPRQVDRMREMSKLFKKVGVDGRFFPIHFKGENIDEIHVNLATQVRSELERSVGEKIVIFGGDGFGGAVLNSIGQVRDEYLNDDYSAAKNIDENPVMIAKGGSLNLFAERAQSNNEVALERFIDDVDLARVGVKRRVLDVSEILNDGSKNVVRTEAHPFAFFAGCGSDSLMLQKHEAQSRAQHWAISAAKIAAQSVKEFWQGDGSFELNALVTIPYFGLIRFPREIDTVDKEGFYHFRAAADNAWDTSKVMLLGHLAMSHARLAKRFLQSDQPYYTLNKIDRWVDQEVKKNCSEGLTFYTDGFPQVFEANPSNGVMVSARTINGPVVNVISFNSSDEIDRSVQNTENNAWNVVVG